MDLYANERQTFWRVTFPIIFPGILAAGCWRSPVDRRLRHHTLQRRAHRHLPLWVFGASRVGIRRRSTCWAR